MERKIKVALMSYAMDNRRGMGTAIYTRRLIEEMLQYQDFEFYLVHFDAVDDPIYSRAHEIRIPHLTLPFATRFVRTMLFFWKYRKEKFDIIHWFQPRPYPFFWLAPARHIVVTAHGAADITAPGAYPFSRRVFNRMMVHFNRYIDAIIAVSEFGRREIIEWYRADPGRVHVTYPGGSERFKVMEREDAVKVARENFGIDRRFILDVSRLEPHKNVETLIKAYRIARDKGISHKLVIVGKNAGDYQRLHDLAFSGGYGNDIIFIAHADGNGLNALYAAADIFVFPSLNEGFGLPLVEAMSVGTPVIASNVTALPEVVGDAGIIVNPLDTERLADEIHRLLSDPALRERLSKRGLERAAMFKWSETAKNTVCLYRAILQNVR
ncbi:MAG: glycosyltransferase family 1 protein [bacterium]|nr:glycosyltransferase family 1 protein [bacterium]